MSRPDVTDEIVEGLGFARACVLDQRTSSHAREDHHWDECYAAALTSIDVVVRAHTRAAKRVRRHAPALMPAQHREQQGAVTKKRRMR